MEGGDPFGAPPSDDAPIVLDPTPPESEDPIVMPPPAPIDDPVVVDPPIPHEDDTSAMATWNAEWMEKLSARKNKENEAKAKAIEQAGKDLEQFVAERDASRESKMSKNRSEEQVKLEALEADLESDNPWERVVKLVDLQQEGEGSDVSRMRSILIQLKNEPIKA
mmetsp:Transcript_18413/g.38339  ORF Transcript_18413/g.38339 Transcript_18413/m.38339 type:complete len:165 (+) Transcript_18413:31-525(+)|eukprot:CAMPEP_0118654470 /NCGR_PEP_ID=MMETSP0785-20121206/12413_1 /TAXON_ID=91992 /ORGANISM="Bolidomonas pacifica, Strain CCMP 1866" /LENGTH=164 /DNA_ID=CAMNT_0006547145 /DNA_START=229 /DNA_END=723 /DNA_ORIENTATION=+